MDHANNFEGANRSIVIDALRKQGIVDMHTHTYPPSFSTPVPNATGQVDKKGLLLCGVDELLTYHYLVAGGLSHRARHEIAL